MTITSLEAAYASQATFRALMDAFAWPGEIKRLQGVSAPAPFAPAAAAMIRSLADFETPVWLDPSFDRTPAPAEWIRFETGARIAKESRDAAFALIHDVRGIPDFETFALGSDEYPDRSTTLIVQIEQFSGREFIVSGPGIKRPRKIAASGLPGDFAARLAANRELFPRGVDLVLVAGEEVMALPRSLRLSESV